MGTVGPIMRLKTIKDQCERVPGGSFTTDIISFLRSVLPRGTPLYIVTYIQLQTNRSYLHTEPLPSLINFICDMDMDT